MKAYAERGINLESNESKISFIGRCHDEFSSFACRGEIVTVIQALVLQPLLTKDRIRDLKLAFEDNGIDGEEEERITDGRTLSIDEAFLVLFTEAEREHLTFDHFLQDLEAFQATRKAMNSTQDSKVMSFETALEFLKEMQ